MFREREAEAMKESMIRVRRRRWSKMFCPIKKTEKKRQHMEWASDDVSLERRHAHESRAAV